MAKLDYETFCDAVTSLTNAYILCVISAKISEGLRGQVHVVRIYAPWSRDRRGVGWMHTGPH